jgi:hypothetical protein
MPALTQPITSLRMKKRLAVEPGASSGMASARKTRQLVHSVRNPK